LGYSEGNPPYIPAHPAFAPIGPASSPGAQGFTAAEAGTAVGSSRASNWLGGLVAGAVTGIIVSVLYATISSLVNWEVLVFMIAVGALPGTVFAAFARPRTLATRLITGVVSVALGFVSVMVAIVLLVGAEALGNIGVVFAHLGELDYAAIVEVYLDEPLGIVWVIAGLVGAAMAGRSRDEKPKR